MGFNQDHFTVIKEFPGNKNSRVNLIEHKQTGKRVILKEVSLVNPEKQKLEAKIHSKLSHRFIVRLIDYKLTDTSILMLIEYAKHGDLFSQLSRVAQFTEERTLKIFYGVVQAVAYLHRLGYVHRDIKPENILLTDNWAPKLGDFGTSAAHKSIRNTFCGTFEYMAPEIYLRDSQSYKVDVWALGVLLYEMLHGKTPFKRDTMKTVEAKLSEQALEFAENVSASTRSFILQMLRFSPADRPDCAELLRSEIFAAFRTRASCDGDAEPDEVTRSLQELGEALRRSGHPNPPVETPTTVKTVLAFPELGCGPSRAKVVRQKPKVKESKQPVFPQSSPSLKARKHALTPLRQPNSSAKRGEQNLFATPPASKLFVSPLKKKDSGKRSVDNRSLVSQGKPVKQIAIYAKNCMSLSQKLDFSKEKPQTRALPNSFNKSAVKDRSAKKAELTTNRQCSIEKVEFLTPQLPKLAKKVELLKLEDVNKKLKFPLLRCNLHSLEEKVHF